MKKKWIVFFGVIVLVPAIMIEAAAAVKHIRLIVNGREITPSVPLYIVKEKTVGSIRDVSEALGASVQWDKEKQAVIVTDTQKQLLEKKARLLENAFVLDTPKEVARNWAKGVMSRNGALQYAVLSDELKKKELSGFKAFDWVTGASSPWADKFQIIGKEEQKDGTWKFTIKFHYTDSTGSSSYSTSYITIGKDQIVDSPLPVYPGFENKWCVVAVE